MLTGFSEASINRAAGSPQTEELVSVKLSRASWPLSNKEKKSALPLPQAVVTLFESMYVERCLGLSLISSAHKG